MFEVAGERNKKRYDHKVDVYSFSLVLWELLTNTTPFKGKCCMTAAYAAVTQVSTCDIFYDGQMQCLDTISIFNNIKSNGYTCVPV